MYLPEDHPFQDFRNFIYAVWKHLGLPDPTPLQYDIAHYLQHGPKRLVIEAFRGVGKSYVTAGFAVWNWLLDPDVKIMVVSASKERSDAFSQFCLRLINDMPELQHLIPRPDQRRSLMIFDVNGARVDQSPSLKSVGITGQLTGSRADIIIADDVETPKNSMTMLQRERLRTLVTEFDAILKPLPTSRIIYLGTPQCEDSLYNHLVPRGYDLRIWPARKPTPEQETRYKGHLAPYIVDLDVPAGSPTDPRRFDVDDLAERENSYGRTGFALQFMLDTSLSDGLRFPLRCSDFIVMDVDREVAPIKVSYGSSQEQLLDVECVGMTGDRWFGPMYISKEHAEYQGSVLFIDPSGRGHDKTAVAVVKMLNGTLYLRRAHALPGGYDEMTLTTIARLAQAERVNQIVVESNFGDGMFTQLLKPYLARIHPCGVDEVWNTKQKELRIIDTLEPVLNSHRLVVDKGVLVADLAIDDPEHQLFYQLTRITRDKGALAHDDLLDAVAGAVAYFIDRMDVDVDQGAQNYLDELWEQEIEAFIANADSSWSRPRTNWSSTV